MNYKPLATETVKNGFRFRQLIREGDLAIFHKVGLRPHEHDAGFEVVMVGRHNGYVMAGNQIEPAETMPSPEQWGSKGWTCKTLLEAERRFNRILNGDIPEDTSEIIPDTEEDETPGQDRDSYSDTQDRESYSVEKIKTIPQWPKSVKEPELKFPEGEFTKKEFSEFNGFPYSAANSVIENLLHQGKVKFMGKKATAGSRKPSAIFTKST
jgi:hypothetical protein